MNVLLIEDDRNLCDAIRQQLEKDHFHLDICNDGEDGLFHALNEAFHYDIAVIDRMLPVIDGLTIIRAMRKKGLQTPVIIITGMAEIDDRITGLDNGADDYLVKPFHIRELAARMRALARRPTPIKSASILAFGDLNFNQSRNRLSCGGTSVLLSKKEADLLTLFLSFPGQIFTREQIIAKVWGNFAEVENGNVDNYVYFLRKRLKSLNSRSQIHAVYGSGYTLEER